MKCSKPCTHAHPNNPSVNTQSEHKRSNKGLHAKHPHRRSPSGSRAKCPPKYDTNQSTKLRNWGAGSPSGTPVLGLRMSSKSRVNSDPISHDSVRKVKTGIWFNYMTEVVKAGDQRTSYKRIQDAQRAEAEVLLTQNVWVPVEREELPRGANVCGGRFAHALKHAGTAEERCKSLDDILRTSMERNTVQQWIIKVQTTTEAQCSDKEKAGV